jgi:rhamnosyltransferase subunit B
MKPEGARRRILFASIGSLGDLHPVIGMAVELKRRGHFVRIASTPFYRERIEALGIEFRPLRPDWDPGDTALIAQCEDIRRGTEVLLRQMVLPYLRDTYNDLLDASPDVDLMIASELVYAAPLVAEKLDMKWASAILSPCSFFSVHDPPVMPNVPELQYLRWIGPRAHRAILRVASATIDHWWEPIRQLRREERLSPGRNPLLYDKFSPELALALFSRHLAEPQPDWPANTIQPGFVFYDRMIQSEALSADLESFFATGEAPIVFTQGSTAVHHPGCFYETSVAAARRIGRRALLIGTEDGGHASGSDVFAARYAPYSQVFPRAAAIVHQGGVGTTGQAMRSGRPMLVVPYGWDQPDQAARIMRMGAGLTLERKRYTPERVARALERLIQEERFERRSAEIGRAMQAEDGVDSACIAIEDLLKRQDYWTLLPSS